MLCSNVDQFCFVCFSQFDYKSICQRQHLHIDLSKMTYHLDEIAQLCIAFLTLLFLKHRSHCNTRGNVRPHITLNKIMEITLLIWDPIITISKTQLFTKCNTSHHSQMSVPFAIISQLKKLTQIDY
jgi:hypothetical protein